MSLEEEDDDAPMVIEEEVDAPPSKKKPAAAPKKKPTAAPKKKPTAPAKKPAAAAPKKRDRSEDEEEEEEEEPAEKHAAVAEEAAAEKPKKERVKHKPRARGDRLASAPVYRTHLNKDRQRRKEKAIKDGKEPPASRRSKPGASVAREIEFLNKANGLYLTTALTRRLAIDAIGKVCPSLIFLSILTHAHTGRAGDSRRVRAHQGASGASRQERARCDCDRV
jgi:hypothetical protein